MEQKQFLESTVKKFWLSLDKMADNLPTIAYECRADFDDSQRQATIDLYATLQDAKRLLSDICPSMVIEARDGLQSLIASEW